MTRVIVVGAGAFGLASALELRRRGHHVILLDPGPLPHPAAASTDVSKIVRLDYGADEFYSRLAHEALRGWERWNEEWGWHPFHRDGFLLLSGGELVPGSFEYESMRTLERLGEALHRLDSPEARARSRLWSRGLHPDGYLSPSAGWVESGRVIAELAVRARDAGIEVREGTAMERFLEGDSRVDGVLTTEGERIEGDLVVVAAGAWTPTLIPELDSVMWATGQPVVHLHPGDPRPYQPEVFPVWCADITRTGWYGFPALPDGRLKIGNHGPGVRIDPRAPRSVPDATLERLRTFLATSLPSLADAPVVARRLCLYCDTFDSDFWIDRAPDREGLVVAAGGSGHGFKFVPVLGEIVADVVEGRESPWAHRFRWRERGEVRVDAARAG